MQNNYSNENYAGFWVRFAAYVIDNIIVAIGLLVVRLAWIGIGALISGTILDGNVLFHYSLKDIVLYIFKVMYFILLTWCTGTTIGKRLMNLRVVPADRNEKLSFVDVLYRETIGRFLCGISVWIGYIIIGIDKEKRGFHDMLCDTRVVYEKKVKIYPEYQKTAGAQPPVQPQPSVQSQAPVQPQPPIQPQAPVQTQAPVQAQMPAQAQPSVQAQMAVQAQPPVQSQEGTFSEPVRTQSGQQYRAVPDGGYSFVGDAGQQSNRFVSTEANQMKTEVSETNEITRNDAEAVEIEENKVADNKKMEDRIESSIKENTQEGDS